MEGSSYSVRDVCKLLGLSRSTVSALTDAGFVSPLRGPRKQFRFSFQDLVLLRAARGLCEAGISKTRVLRALRRLKTQLPEDAPLGGLRIEAIGDAVVVNSDEHPWQAYDGQYVMRFSVEGKSGQVAFIDSSPESPSPQEWFDRASLLEDSNWMEACAAYSAALVADPTYADAYINLGRLRHLHGDLTGAEATYRDGLARCGADGTALFNLAVLLEDTCRNEEAAVVYRAALDANPTMADAHFNLARLCQGQGQMKEALRHFNAYRKYSA